MNNNHLLKIIAGVPVRPGRLHHLSLLEEAVLEQPSPLETVIQPGWVETGNAGRNYAQDAVVVARPRKTRFIRRFDGTGGLVCNRFYRLILSNGCPFHCQYCYLRLRLGDNKGPLVFTNQWLEVQPAICRETPGLWEELGWKSKGCNCTPNHDGRGSEAQPVNLQGSNCTFT